MRRVMRKLNEVYRIKLAGALDYHVSSYNEYKWSKNRVSVESKLRELGELECKLKKSRIKCFKYNHAIDDSIQDSTSF